MDSSIPHLDAALIQKQPICRGDVSANVCKRCVETAAKDIVKLCPLKKEAVVFYDYCLLRYSDKNIFGIWYQYLIIDSSDDRHNVSEPQRFYKELANLMTELTTRVVNDDRKGKKFATQEVNFTPTQKVYALAQCTPDISSDICKACLSQDINERSNAKSLHYDFGAIQDATNNFSVGNRIGQGGFGDVYKGKLPNGREIAVKRLSQSSNQGAEEFKSEVLLVAKLQHRNLVRLLGFCLQGVERILIYEFVPNKSLDCYLFDHERRGALNWTVRLMIIRGIARGLLYLHEDCPLKIVHRDLKPSNILLDAEMKPKISDFGMARIFEAHQTQGNTMRVVGT